LQSVDYLLHFEILFVTWCLYMENWSF